MFINPMPGFRMLRAAADDGAAAGGGSSPAPTAAPAATPAPTPAPSPTPAPTSAPSGTPSPTPAPTQDPSAKTIAEGGGQQKDVTVAADWPADWRIKLAGEDKKLLAQLERYGSPVDLAKKIREQDALIAQGKHKTGLPKDATPEQIAAYRKENNIPEAADKYDLTLPDGLVIGESDKPVVNNLLGTMHEANLNNDQVKAIMSAYYKNEKEFLQKRADDIAEKKIKNDDLLHQEWGDDYRPNLNILGSLTKSFSQSTNAALAGAVDSDGFPLLNNPSFIKDMVVMARTINPVDTVVGSGGGNQMSSVDDEIKQIEAKMGGTKEERAAYFKDEKMQARYRQLVEFKEKNAKVA